MVVKVCHRPSNTPPEEKNTYSYTLLRSESTASVVLAALSSAMRE